MFDFPLQTGLSYPLNSVHSITLPIISDGDRDTVTLTTFESGSTTLPSFIVFNNPTYTFSPTQFSEVGVHTISVWLDDGFFGSPVKDSFTVTVTNSAPYLKTLMPDVTIHVNEVRTALIDN
jgi:hypothetical protein